MLPSRGGAGRARAMSTLETMAHARMVDPEIGDLLAELAEDDSLDEWQRASVRIFKHDYDKATRVPPDLVGALAQARGDAYQAWTEARPKADFEMLEPHLEKLISLRKQEADAVGWEEERYDALLDDFEPFMRTSEVARMFDDLSAQLKPVAETILDQVGPRQRFLTEAYDEETQERFCHWLIAQIGFDMEAGRVDTSPHPFTAGIAPGDVRQTIRMERDNVFASIYAAMHETGHALYEQGIPDELRDLPVGRAPSLGVHESQSRMWENHVGRSREFTRFMLPHLKEYFPSQLGSVSPDEFYEGANRPERSLIRVYADEVTYNLHLVLRFQMELALFRDELQVADLPGVWNEKSQEHIGIRANDDGDGVLQDMHWSIGALGYFPTYTLGTLYAAAFYEKASADLGGLSTDLARGDGSRLHAWLNEHIFQKAFIKPGKELGEDVLGKPLTVTPFIDHLKTKYADIYDVSFSD
jgi:carboxypeptidase Taq